MQKTRQKRTLQISILLIMVCTAFYMVSINTSDVYAKENIPKKIKTVKLTDRTSSSLSIEWSKSKKARKYQVAYKKAGTKAFIIKTTVEKETVLDQLKADTNYLVKVRGIKGKKAGKWTKPKKYKTLTKNGGETQHTHIWDAGVVTKEATYDEAGERTYTCEICGEIKVEEIEKLTPPEDDPIQDPASGSETSTDINIAPKINISATETEIKINLVANGGSGTAQLYSAHANEYIKGDAVSGIVEDKVAGTKITSFGLDESKTVAIPRISRAGYDRLYDKYYVIKDEKILGGPVYVTEVDSQDRAVELKVPSKKGLVDEMSEETYTASKDLGSNWTAMNIDFTELILANETEDGRKIDNSSRNADTIAVNGKTIYINKDYVNFLDSRLSRFQDMNINVVGVVISFVSTEKSNHYPRALKYIDDARWTNGFNTSTELGRDYFVAGMEYLANRYSKGNKGLICDYVIGNEIDLTYDWYEIIPNESKTGEKLPPRGSLYMREGEVEAAASLDTFMEEFSRTLRLADLSVKKYSKDIKVGVSISNQWASSRRDNLTIGQIQSRNNKGYDSYRPKEMLNWLCARTKKTGDFDWTLTPHSYCVEHGNTAAYESGLTRDTPAITGNPDTSKVITQNNLEVLQIYLDKPENQFNGKSREMYFTETGSSSHSSTDLPTATQQKEQAASVAQFYYRAASLPSTKAIIYYKLTDRDLEGSTSFKLGLKDKSGKKKLAYNVWKYIDTNRSEAVADKYLPNISFIKNTTIYKTENGNLNSYLDVMPIVNSSFDWPAHWDIEALTPVQIETADDVERSLATDKTTYQADEPIMVTATGAGTDLVGLYKRGETADDDPIYSYEVGGDSDGTQHASGKAYDIRAYGLNTERMDDAELPEGEYSVILSDSGEAIEKIDITITGTSVFAGSKIVRTNKTNYKVGEDILVSASGAGKDWVGIYKKDEVPSATVNSFYWYYVSDSNHVPGKPFVIQHGSTNNRATTLPAGEYEVILQANDGYSIIAKTSLSIGSASGAVENISRVKYTMKNPTDGYANGEVAITTASDADGMDCLMYWGDSEGKPLEGYASLAKFRLSGKLTMHTLQANTIIPPGAKTLLAYMVNGNTKSDEPAIAELPEGCNYELEDNPIIQFPVVSDLHVVNEGSGNDFNENTNDHVTKMLEDVMENLPGSIGVFANGDIADHGKASEYQEVMNLFQAVEGAPYMHMAIGNHDWRTGNPGNQFQKYVNWFNPNVETETVYYDEWVNGYHFIFLGGEAAGDNAQLSQKQLDWLEALLAEDAKKDQNKPIFLFLHQGLQNSMAGNYPGQWGYDHGVNQDEQLAEIVSRYGQVIMFGGHTHYELDTENSVTPGSSKLPISVNTAAIGYLWNAYNTPAGEYMAGAHGYYVKVFKDKVYMFGRNFMTGEFMPSSMYVIEPAKLDVAATQLNLSAGDAAVNLNVVTEGDMPVTYSSSDPKIASVDEDGNVKSVAPGTARIFISTDGSDTKMINRKIVSVTVK